MGAETSSIVYSKSILRKMTELASTAGLVTTETWDGIHAFDLPIPIYANGRLHKKVNQRVMTVTVNWKGDIYDISCDGAYM